MKICKTNQPFIFTDCKNPVGIKSGFRVERVGVDMNSTCSSKLPKNTSHVISWATCIGCYSGNTFTYELVKMSEGTKIIDRKTRSPPSGYLGGSNVHFEYFESQGPFSWVSYRQMDGFKKELGFIVVHLCN